MDARLLRALAVLVVGAVAATPLHADPRGARMPAPDVVRANAGGTPIDDGGKTFAAFHGKAGIRRIASDLVDRTSTDPRIAAVFKDHDLKHLKHMLAAQFCYLLGGPCTYTGRSMAKAHAGLGLRDADVGALVEDLQAAMDKEGVPFRAQNKLLAKLAPSKRAVVER